MTLSLHPCARCGAATTNTWCRSCTEYERQEGLREGSRANDADGRTKAPGIKRAAPSLARVRWLEKELPQ